MSETKELDFLSQLSEYNIDQPKAISSPRNWKDKPLLEVDFGVYNNSKVERLIDSLLMETPKGKWFFLTGSPGNGKSAFCGKLYRHIEKRKGFEFDPEPSEEILPYCIDVKKSEEKFKRLSIIQDATVLNNKFEKQPNEGKQLFDNLLDNYEKGRSLVVCANNGIIQLTLEYAEERYSEEKSANIETIRKLLSDISLNKAIPPIEVPSNGGKTVNKTLEIEHYKQDLESLLHSDEYPKGGPFRKILSEVTKDNNWENCTRCEIKNLCPFFQNKEDFKKEDIKDSFIQQLRRIEVLMGQVLPFRALLSFVANFFGGIKIKDTHPCDYVKKLVKSHNFFELISYRYYLRFHNFGRDVGEIVFGDKLEKLLEANCTDRTSRALKHLPLNLEKIQGVSSGIFDEGGLHRFLDLRNSTLDQIEDLDQFSVENINLLKEYSICGDLEKELIDIFMNIEEVITNFSNNDTVEHILKVNTWAKDFIIPLYSYQHKIFNNSVALDEFIYLLRYNYIEERDRPPRELKDLLKELEKFIPKSLQLKNIDGQTRIRIGDRFEYEGIEPEFQINANKRNKLVLSVLLKNQKEIEIFKISAKNYLWISEMKKRNLAFFSLPSATEEDFKEFKCKIGDTIELSELEDCKLILEKEVGKRILWEKDRDGIYCKEI